MTLRAGALGSLLATVVTVTPAVVAAQVSPTAPVHPTMPWAGITTPYGQFIRFVYVPPQPVTLQFLVQSPLDTPSEPAPRVPAADGGTKVEEPPAPAPAAEPAPAPPQVVTQQIMVPGYHVRETTVGYYYPERWGIEQTGINAYRWRRLPAQFLPR